MPAPAPLERIPSLASITPSVRTLFQMKSDSQRPPRLVMSPDSPLFTGSTSEDVSASEKKPERSLPAAATVRVRPAAAAAAAAGEGRAPAVPGAGRREARRVEDFMLPAGGRRRGRPCVEGSGLLATLDASFY